MTAASENAAPRDVWTAAIYGSQRGRDLLGTGVVIDKQRVLTCAHVVVGPDGKRRPDLWIAFPKTVPAYQLRTLVVDVRLGQPDGVPEHAVDRSINDVAVLCLESAVPHLVQPAPLRLPVADHLIATAWWACGFPAGGQLDATASGTIGEGSSWGWIALTTESRTPVVVGFSGAGLWSHSYEAVVGLVGQVNDQGDARALLMSEIHPLFRDERIDQLAEFAVAQAEESVLAAWGWRLVDDLETGRHWAPRARGVAAESEQGYRFSGRRAALTEIIAWLGRDQPDGRVLVLTGSPGVGKSAVLGRIVTTADPDFSAEMPMDGGVWAPERIVGCAVHVKGKTALEVAQEIARAVSASIPDVVHELTSALSAALLRYPDRRFNIVLDALDEAQTPEDARTIVTGIVLPITHELRTRGVQVVVGTRPRDDRGNLLDAFGGLATIVDLDDESYFDEDDLYAYALASLQLRGAERLNNPYDDDAVAGPIAAKIAAGAQRNFLIAGMVARAHGLRDVVAAPPEEFSFTPTIEQALSDLIEPLPGVGRASARDVLGALAFAESPGYTADVWQAAVRALASAVSAAELEQFAQTSAANFLVEAAGPDGRRLYRLFHQALSDALLNARAEHRPRDADEEALTHAFVLLGRQSGWSGADRYLLRSLPVHAFRAGLVDELLTDDQYLIHADLASLTAVADRADSRAARARARMLHLTPRALAAAPADRAAMFSVTCLLDKLRPGLVVDTPMPYQARWAAVTPRVEWAVLEGSPSAVSAVCDVVADGRHRLASAGDDGRVRLWDVGSSQAVLDIDTTSKPARALCTTTVAGRVLLVVGCGDGSLRLWDAADGSPVQVLRRHQDGPVRSVCSYTVDDRPFLASVGIDRTVRVWDLTTGEMALLPGRKVAVWDVCSYVDKGEVFLAAAGGDGAVTIWPAPQRLPLGPTRAGRSRKDQKSQVYAICPILVNGRTLLVTGGADGVIRVWDPSPARSSDPAVRWEGHTGPVRSLSLVDVDENRFLVASSSEDRTVRLWDPATGEQVHLFVTAAARGAGSVCGVSVEGRPFVAAGCLDHAVRLWDPAPAETAPPAGGGIGDQPLADSEPGIGLVNALGVHRDSNAAVLASAGNDGTVRVWDVHRGHQLYALTETGDSARALCVLPHPEGPLVAAAGTSGAIRIVDPVTGEVRLRIRDGSGPVLAMAAFEVDGRTVLAVGGHADGTVRLVDPDTGTLINHFRAQPSAVRGICVPIVDDRPVVVTTAADGELRLLDPTDGKERARIPLPRSTATGAVCAFQVGDRFRIAAAAQDRTIRIWHADNPRQQIGKLSGHAGIVRDVCSFVHNGRIVLASASLDRTVRIWDARSGSTNLHTIPVHHQAASVAYTDNILVVGLHTGLMGLEITATG